jgi:hypothetical protein
MYFVLCLKRKLKTSSAVITHHRQHNRKAIAEKLSDGCFLGQIQGNDRQALTLVSYL